MSSRDPTACQDEARVGQVGCTGHVWFEHGQPARTCAPGRLDFRRRPPGARYRGRACDHRGDAIAAQRDALALDPEAQAILLLDRAGWRRAKRLVSPANVTPLHLPPYSPELGIERVSFYLRERFLTHRGVDHAEATIDACCQAWNRLLAETGRLQTLAALPGLQRSILGKIGITPQ